MFSISGVLKMFGGKLDEIIKSKGGELKLSVPAIEEWAVKEKIPYKLTVNENKEIVIVKR